MKSHSSTRRKSKTAPPLAPPRPGLASRFTPAQLQELFLQLLQPAAVAGWLPHRQRGFYQRLFTPLIVLWYFLFSRLQAQPRLQDVVDDAHQGGADRLCPPHQPLSQRLRSWATPSWSNARKRFPLAVFHQALPTLARQIQAWVQECRWREFRVILLDGSTVRLRPYGDIPRQFPPHGGGKSKRSYWCLMRVVVGFCLSTAVVVGSAIGALTVSEQILACQLLLQAGPQSLFLGDRNFGIYRIAQVARHAHAQLLVRLTESRARKLARSQGQRLRPGLDALVSWEPSRQDQRQPEIADDPVPGRLLVARLQRKGYRPVVLYLFTTLTDGQLYSATDLVALYGARWQVELDLRYLKTQMGLHTLTCQSAAMAQKEWLAGLMAYNLIRAAMVAAAVQEHRSIYDLSFATTKALLRDWLIRLSANPEQAARGWQNMMEGILARRHPHRTKERPSEPRAKRPFGEAVPTLYGSRQLARKQWLKKRAK